MAYRRFNGKEYLVPGVDTAIQQLRPGSVSYTHLTLPTTNSV